MTTFALSGEIKFPKNAERPGFTIRRFSECKIESSWKSLTNTAEITIPRNLSNFDRMKVTEWFRQGDPVFIELGYDQNQYIEFSGYITNVSVGIPVKIQCQDEMYMLKQNTISISKANSNLMELLRAIAPGYDIVCDETQLIGSIRFQNLTPAQCLDELRKQGIACFFVDKTLHALDMSSRIDGKIHNIIIERTVSEGLKVKEVQETKVIVELIRRKGKKIKVEYGDKNAATRIVRSYSGIEMNENELNDLAKRIYNQAKTPGLDGDITLFGIPRVQVGDKLKLMSTLYRDQPEFNNTYRIDAVTKTFSRQGYRQICTLGDKVE